MWMAYAFTALSLVSLPAAVLSHSALVMVSWLAQTCIQLVLLPVIMVGQDVTGRRTEAVILDTHALAVAEHEDTRTLIHDVREVLSAVHSAISDAETLANGESGDTSTQTVGGTP